MYRFKPQWRGKLSRHDCKNCWLLCKELAQTNLNLTNYSCYCLILFVWFNSLRPSVLRKDQHVSCSRTQCKLGPTTPRSQVKHSTTEPLRPPLLMFINPVMPDKIVYTGLLVISFAAFFYSKLCWPCLERSHIWAVSWDCHQCGIFTGIECNKPMQPHFKRKTPNDIRSVT